MRARSLAVLIGLGIAGCGEREARGEMELVQVVHELTGEGSFETVRARADGAPSVRVLCPALSGEVDGGDMPALVVPPPGEVRLVLPPDSTPARLVARVGLDHSTFTRLSAAAPGLRVAFELRTGERVLAREELELVRGKRRDNTWRDLCGATGLALEGSETLTLRTEALRADGTRFEPPFPVLAGFGGLRLERRLARARTASSRARPNVVLVVMDTLRADRLSAYGYPRPTSPHLEELARRGTLFDTCYSNASWTWPATASMLTGLTPLEHGLGSKGSSFLPEKAETLAERLQHAGFTTAAWSGNPIVSPARNFDQGFERFRNPPEVFQKSAEFFGEVRAFLRAQAGTRFFLYLHLADPHAPLRPLEEGARLLAAEVPPDFSARCDTLWAATSQGQGVLPGGELALDPIARPEERAWTSQLYDASVWSGDHWLGELLAELAALGLEDETIVAFTSDHGEELFERGYLGHGQSLRSELVHVPLVLAGPGVARGVRNSGLISARKVAPLLARLAGVEFEGGEEVMTALAGGGRFQDFVLFTTTKGAWKGRHNVRLAGLTDGTWKLAVAENGAPWGQAEPPPEGDWELFDLHGDPSEQQDLSASRPELVTRLRAVLEERSSNLRARRIGVAIPAGDATLRMLDALGYGGGEH